MQAGYIAIETHHERPGVVRLLTFEQSPDPQSAVDSPRRIRYIARYNDRQAALMHTHEILKRRLIDVDAHLYRAPLEQAIAAAESLDIKHRRIFLDPDLTDQSIEAITQATERLRARHRAWSSFFQILGYIGVGLLLLNMFLLTFR